MWHAAHDASPLLDVEGASYSNGRPVFTLRRLGVVDRQVAISLLVAVLITESALSKRVKT